ncbi:MAG TPA: hypothetical protein VN047_01520 [Sphingopyxis sp.]|nr:hypothetical protein [Sphingopyxis sp.]
MPGVRLNPIPPSEVSLSARHAARFSDRNGLPIVLVELDIGLVVALKPVAPMIILELLLAEIMRQAARQVG